MPLKVKPLQNYELLDCLSSNDGLKNFGFGKSYAYVLDLLQHHHAYLSFI